MKILVTGSAGFIGYHLVVKLLKEGHQVWGIDNINDYYDTKLKYGRLKESGVDQEDIEWGKWVKSSLSSNYNFMRVDIVNNLDMKALFESNVFDQVVHLAAQPGVRYSLENPHAYVETNVVGFLNILEGCKESGISKLLYASSSSVYGQNASIPFSEKDRVDYPVSLYAATKKSNELMAFAYSHLYGFQAIGLRFFTVYGPWGRPDMAPMLFANAAINNDTIKVFNYGNQSRDFTYIDDIVEGVYLALGINLDKTPKVDIFNIGNGKPVALMDFIEELQDSLNMKIKMDYVEAQPGDVSRTYADTSKLSEITGYNPKVNITDGVNLFVDWMKNIDN